MTAPSLVSGEGRLASRLARSDYWRIAPPRADDVTRTRVVHRSRVVHKEWQHFCVFDGEVEMLVNWSLMDGVQTGRGDARPVPRLAVLARDAAGWVGEIERFALDDVEIRAGDIAARFGSHRLSLDATGYRLDVDVASGALGAKLRCEPLATPALTNSVPLAFGGSIRWLIVPRLRCHGEIRLHDRRHRIDGALGYHDHNWGPFQWGSDFAWDWAIALPDDSTCPFSVVLTRLTDRGRLRSISDGLLVWEDQVLARGFRGDQVRVESRGRFDPPHRPLRIPRVAWLASSGESSPAPERYLVRAAGQGDRVDLELCTEDVAQIAIPNDADDDGLTILTEVHARANVEGRIRGRPLAWQGPALLELIHVER